MRGNKNNPRRNHKNSQPTSIARIELTSGGWKAFPLTQEQELELLPLQVLCEAIGLEMIVVKEEPKSKQNSKARR